MNTDTIKTLAKPAALLAAGATAGVVVAGTLSANAESSPSPFPSSSAPAFAPHRDGLPPPPSDETLLTGATRSKVEAAVLAVYPNATIVRTETDSDGVYESHIVTADGQPLTVEVGKGFKVTGAEAFRPR